MHPYSFFMTQDPRYLLSGSFGFGPFAIFMFILVVLEVALKGLGLWRAARMSKTGWFVALLLINTAGILPFIFLLLTKNEYEHHLKGEKMIA